MNLKSLYEKVFEGQDLTYDELVFTAENAELDDLMHHANMVRDKFQGNKVNLCTAINLKSGRCNEDCRYCSQSMFYNTHATSYPMKDQQEVLDFAMAHENKGVTNFELSTSGGELARLERDKLLSIIRALSEKTTMRICGAHGILKSVTEAKALKDAGMSVYQHNLQASRKYFNNVITTHEYQDRIDTLRYAKEAGLALCSGCVVGLGESITDHIDMALDLRDIGIVSLPINILNPIPGTPYGDKKISVTKEDVFRIISIYRLALPQTEIIYGAGRVFLDDELYKAFTCGLNGIVVGENFLTTKGRHISEDVDMIKDQGFFINKVSSQG